MIVKGESTHASGLFRTPHAAEALDRILTFMNRHKG